MIMRLFTSPKLNCSGVCEKGFSFERLGVDARKRKGANEKIDRKTTAGTNSCFSLVLSLFKSRKLSKRAEIWPHKNLMYCIRAKKQLHAKRLTIFKRKILRRIFGPKRNNEYK